MTYKPTAADRKEVEKMIGLGFPVKDIALVKGITAPTLRKYYAVELKLGRVRANVRVANKLFSMATRPKASPAAVIFWLKVRAGWKEPPATAALGKKEQAEVDARTAEQGTDWAGLLQ